MPIAIVVPGHGRVGRSGEHSISGRCRSLVLEAERLAAPLEPEVVVFTGWSSSGGRSEAEQMRDSWRGPALELVVEPTARTTAENASRTLPLLLERGIRGAVVVCAAPHVLRVRLLFGRIYASRGVAVAVDAARAGYSLRAFVWEALALPLVPIQARQARAELQRVLS